MPPSLSQDQISVAVDLLILTVRDGRLQALLSQRTAEPFRDRWALPGHLLGLHDSAEATARDLLNEMLGIQGAYLEQLYTFTGVDRDPRTRVISIAYLVALPWSRAEEAMRRSAMTHFAVTMRDGQLQLSNQAGETLSEEDLAFDHGAMIRMSIQRLREKIESSDVAFRFLEDDQAFSFSDLQEVFEAIQGKRLDKSNFRRGLLLRYKDDDRIQETDLEKRRPPRKGRPAALYRLVPAKADQVKEERL